MESRKGLVVTVTCRKRVQYMCRANWMSVVMGRVEL